MGGIGSGGRRPGAGRKPKDAILRALDGGRASHSRKPATVLPHPSSDGLEPPAPKLPQVDEADAPIEFDAEERAVWLELAPHAILARTLTPATSLGFRMLCRNVVMERNYSKSVLERGSANHRGLIQRIDAELLRFNLAPCGKPIASVEPTEKPIDPLKARYFARRG